MCITVSNSFLFSVKLYIGQGIQERTKKNLWKTGLSSFMVCLSRAYHFKFLKGCPPLFNFGIFLSTLFHIFSISNVKA